MFVWLLYLTKTLNILSFNSLTYQNSISTAILVCIHLYLLNRFYMFLQYFFFLVQIYHRTMQMNKCFVKVNFWRRDNSSSWSLPHNQITSIWSFAYTNFNISVRRICPTNLFCTRKATVIAWKHFIRIQ